MSLSQKMMAPITRLATAAVSTAPAEMSLMILISGCDSLLTRLQSFSMAEFTISRHSTKAMQITTIVHSVFEIFRKKPKPVTINAANNCNCPFFSRRMKHFIPFRAYFTECINRINQISVKYISSSSPRPISTKMRCKTHTQKYDTSHHLRNARFL